MREAQIDVPKNLPFNLNRLEINDLALQSVSSFR